MNSKKTHSENLPRIGEVQFTQNKRARRIRITIQSSSTIKVTYPLSVTRKQARKLVQEKEAWIVKQHRNLAQLEAMHNSLRATNPPLNPDTAKQTLIKRLDELAMQHGFHYNRVFVRNQRTRWGSCSSKNNINLNIKLMQLPAELRDYVILHELVHLRVKNHSNAFWSLLDQYLPGAKSLNKKLKQYRISLLA